MKTIICEHWRGMLVGDVSKHLTDANKTSEITFWRIRRDHIPEEFTIFREELSEFRKWLEEILKETTDNS